MTGFGQGEAANNEYRINLSIKAINHRYLEIYCKIPRNFSFLEEGIRRELGKRLSRGKIEVLLEIKKFTSNDNLVEPNTPLAASYLKSLRDLQEKLSISGKIEITALLSLPEVFTVTAPAENIELLETATQTALEQAVVQLLEMRTAEGRNLTVNLTERIAFLEKQYLELQKIAPLVVGLYQEKLTKRVAELTQGIEIDPHRLAMEVALFADKADISEELTRIKSHLQQFVNILVTDKSIGRKLDFLIQELNREINTISSKANDLKIAQIVIDFKTELEKIREQIQNIE